jgi:tryptophanyl-tRNA synthetase
MRATTDSGREIRYDQNRPGLFNLLVIYELMSDMRRDDVEARFAGRGYKDLKHELADLVIEQLRPLQTRYRELSADPSAIESRLARAAQRVRPVANETLALVRERTGLG